MSLTDWMVFLSPQEALPTRLGPQPHPLPCLHSFPSVLIQSQGINPLHRPVALHAHGQSHRIVLLPWRTISHLPSPQNSPILFPIILHWMTSLPIFLRKQQLSGEASIDSTCLSIYVLLFFPSSHHDPTLESSLLCTWISFAFFLLNLYFPTLAHWDHFYQLIHNIFHICLKTIFLDPTSPSSNCPSFSSA